MSRTIPPSPEVRAAAPPPPQPTAPQDHAPLRDAAIQVLSGAAAGRTLDLTKNLTTIGKPASVIPYAS